MRSVCIFSLSSVFYSLLSGPIQAFLAKGQAPTPESLEGLNYTAEVKVSDATITDVSTKIWV